MVLVAYIKFSRVENASRLRLWMYRVVGVTTIALVTSACAPLQPAPSTPAPIESRQPSAVQKTSPVEKPSPVQQPSQVAPKKIAPASQSNRPAQQAVSSLLQEGWAYYRLENYQRAIAIAGRAQRLDPQRAEVYLLLARGNFAQGKYGLAEQLGQRGLSFSQNEALIQRKLQDLLAQIREVAF